MMKDLTVEQLLNDIASESPETGGGTVSGVAGALSAALISMVCQLSIGKKDYRQFEAELKGILESAINLNQELQLLIEKDTEVFNEIMSSYSLPHQTDDEKEIRKTAIEESTKKATLIPMDILHRCERLAQLSLAVVLKGNENSVNDGGIAGIMAYASAESASLNILLNLSTISDEDFRGKVKAELDKVLKSVKNIKDEILQVVKSKL
jgi:formiminotetrahydrofolate cyclodeaminase